VASSGGGTRGAGRSSGGSSSGSRPPRAAFGATPFSEARLARTALALLDGPGTHLLARCRVPAAKAAALVAAVRGSYLANPFHSWAHAVNTAQAASLLAASPEAAVALTPLDTLLLLVAALGHDMGHPGTNNAFAVGAASAPAIVHGDEATLERFHAAQLTAAVTDVRGGSDILAGLSPAAAALARRRLLRTVLATDMARHIAAVEALTARKRRMLAWGGGSSAGSTSSVPAATSRGPAAGRIAGGGVDSGVAGAPFDIKTDADVEELMGTIVHVADFAGNARALDDTHEWTARLVAEFQAQAAAEGRLGLPVTPFMTALDTEARVAALQRAFVGGVIAPLWRAAGALLSGLEEPLRNVEASRLHFEAQCAASEAGSVLAGSSPSRSSHHSGKSPSSRASRVSSTHALEDVAVTVLAESAVVHEAAAEVVVVSEPAARLAV